MALKRYQRFFFVVLFLPYLVLTTGVAGLHGFSCSHFVFKLQEVYPLDGKGSQGVSGALSCAYWSNPSHDSDHCVICQWLKHSSQTLQSDSVAWHFVPADFSGLYYAPPLFASPIDKKPSRAPPNLV